MRRCAAFAALIAFVTGAAGVGRAQTEGRAATFRFVPTARAQVAIWLESSDGARFATVRLTDAVGRRGVGNRPGASQMNSGYHWPYGRREGVLPVWAHRRAAAGGASFPRVVFQLRPEGYASPTCRDSTPDGYFCLSFEISTTKREGLDAITCASPFNGDKGRFITSSDIANEYSEPFVEERADVMRPTATSAAARAARWGSRCSRCCSGRGGDARARGCLSRARLLCCAAREPERSDVSHHRARSRGLPAARG